MNTELFIAKHLLFSKDKQSNISDPIIKIAVIGIALSLAVMILSVAIVTGFKKEIRNKVIGFGSHIQIVNYDSNSSYETAPINKNQAFYPFIDTVPGINHIQVFATKAGIIKTPDALEGIVLKGVGSDFNWNFFNNYIVEGKSFRVNDSVKSDKILLSRHTASLLNLSLHDTIAMFFIQEPIRMRKFLIEGIYNTSLENFDKLFALVDISHIQKLNKWTSDQVSGFEITINDFSKLDEYTELVNNITGYDLKEDGSLLKVYNIIDKYPYIFDWLDIIDANVWVLLFLLLAVSGVNMMSGLLIMILERTNMIGLLKAFGCKNNSVRKLFLYLSGFLINKGLFWGNIVGVLLCLIQKYTGLIKLNPSSYFLESVPINLTLTHLFILNMGTLTAIIIMLMIPSLIIYKISPDKTIKFN